MLELRYHACPQEPTQFLQSSCDGVRPQRDWSRRSARLGAWPLQNDQHGSTLIAVCAQCDNRSSGDSFKPVPLARGSSRLGIRSGQRDCSIQVKIENRAVRTGAQPPVEAQCQLVSRRCEPRTAVGCRLQGFSSSTLAGWSWSAGPLHFRSSVGRHSGAPDRGATLSGPACCYRRTRGHV